MDMPDLRAFVAVAETGSFSRAAERLELAQPAVSRRVARLELDLGVTVLHRTTRRVSLTPAGERLLERARGLLSEMDRTESEVRLVASGQAGRVSIGFVGTATYDVLPQVAREVSHELPELTLDLRGELLTPDLVAGLRDRSIDLALLRPDAGGDAGLEVTPLRSERLVAVLPSHHRLARRRRVRLAELAGETFVMHPAGRRSVMHQVVLGACSDAGFTPVSQVEVSETATLVVFVAAGLGVALVPEPVRTLGLEGVAYVALHRPPTIDLALARREGASSHGVELVAAIVARCVAR